MIDPMTRTTWLPWQRTVSVLFIWNTLLLTSGCGGGIALIVVWLDDDDDSGGSANASPVVSSLQLTDERGRSPPKTSPATISFVLADAESDPVDVEISYASPRGDGTIAKLTELATSPSGSPHHCLWDYADDMGSGYTRDVTVSVLITGGTDPTTSDFDVGNDCPEVESIELPELDEVVGIVFVEVGISDSSTDVVSVLVEYAVITGGPASQEEQVICEPPSGAGHPRDRKLDEDGLEWRRAQPVRLHVPDCTPFFAIQNIEAAAGGTTVQFFWDVLADLGNTEARVKLRFTPYDGVDWGEAKLSPPIHLDNNEAPRVEIDSNWFLEGTDERRGILIPFEVYDADEDQVLVLFQWRLEEESSTSYPRLPDDPEELRRILADPELRREYRVVSEFPVFVEGQVAVVDSGKDPEGVMARLPELAQGAATLIGRGLEGKEIEILRHANRVETIGAGWDLAHPVAAVTLGDGITALVLDCYRQVQPDEARKAIAQVFRVG